MLKTVSSAIVAILAITLGFFYFFSPVDPIHGTKPITLALAKDFPLDDFYQLGEKGDTTAQKEIIKKYQNVISKNIYTYYPDIDCTNTIKFVLASGSVKDVVAADGETYAGEFENEFIVVLGGNGREDTIFVAGAQRALSPIVWRSYSDLTQK